MANIIIFGDSIGQGYYDAEGGWVVRLKRFYSAQNAKDPYKLSVNVFNLSISGDTTQEILDRFEKETPARVWEDHEIIVTFAVGINDSVILSDGKNRTSIENFKKNLNKLLNLAKEHSNKIIFIGLTPIEQSKVDPIPWAPEKSTKEKFVEKYDKVIKYFCKKNNLPYLYLYDKLTTKDLADGAHPNTKGHEIIFETVKNFLEEKKYI
ncbi:MAG: Lysophospholipase L1 and related esterases family [Candidatus Woesebacteria bacterium GW2011_GWB1_39_12]|uniref:Lysophospholipase L1 and related esterases family n=2 Tax=Candidatus Woeseibacteriota TaxID=1752722 RepID=A0A0G0MDG5_9BACT|nr:MAG: Lysophospholipase L1 and related esterases family [Candidatus Woesebacteria bacterium GW2011_GWA1_39_12]KKR01439.1 MAG: Lysophospholipase L1 and related esterases family [Candidatus Woesebacteria bacterium GW2011_GWB1_39_12]